MNEPLDNPLILIGVFLVFTVPLFCFVRVFYSVTYGTGKLARKYFGSPNNKKIQTISRWISGIVFHIPIFILPSLLIFDYLFDPVVNIESPDVVSFYLMIPFILVGSILVFIAGVHSQYPYDFWRCMYNLGKAE